MLARGGFDGQFPRAERRHFVGGFVEQLLERSAEALALEHELPALACILWHQRCVARKTVARRGFTSAGAAASLLAAKAPEAEHGADMAEQQRFGMLSRHRLRCRLGATRKC